ncbi:putative holliday junction resolvase [Nitrosomonas sp. PY1]|uniref:Holliday junction resolvase RuvX n=1 Tax=Nitrosomonas sp. PY1 TaxID=1803906 RepID=UPI001FC89C38|nr:Holliday junction resolvase RuvX [Nitrosomonas sp. PY1]GKS68412.1 putative holliday junction resolvase [Nitrosomonas sp. PY1]
MSLQQLPEGTILAFDFGKKRIGVAVGNTLTTLAQPLKTIHHETNVQRFLAIEKMIQTWQPVLLVVGLPTHIDGTPHEMTNLSRRFAQRLHGRFNIPTVLVDERYTSQTAAIALREAVTTIKKQKAILDQVAAQQILQSFFDENKHAIT